MRALIATLLAVALLAPAARAKGPSFTEVCGASECRSVEDDRIRDALVGDAEQISPPRAGPFFTVRFLVRSKMVMGHQTFDRFEASYLPSSRAVRTTGEGGDPLWRRLGPGAVRAYRRATWSLRPLPVARIGWMGEPIRAEGAGRSRSRQRAERRSRPPPPGETHEPLTMRDIRRSQSDSHAEIDVLHLASSPRRPPPGHAPHRHATVN